MSGQRSGPAAPARRLSAPVRQVVARFAEVACPPEVRSKGRTQRVLDEFELLLAAMQPGTPRMLSAAFLAFDRGARLYPRARGRRFVRLGDEVADAYLTTLMAGRGSTAEMVRHIKSMIAMCYYDLPDVKEEVGYRPAPYVAAVSRRRMESYGPEIRAGEAAALAPEAPAPDPGPAPGQPGERP